jgi:uncharacterized membrane protein YoaK (UPF0700 family)
METLHDARPRLISPKFEHVAFPTALAFVSGFIDLFGFMAWYGLLAAHVTGNLLFFALDVAHGRYDLAMKLCALPIFAVSVAVSTWFIHALKESGRHPFIPVILLQAGAIGLCLLAGLVLPHPRGPDELPSVVMGSIALFAMGLQNTTMRLILNNLPATTVMTGNITQVMSDSVRWLVGYGLEVPGETEALRHRAQLIGITLSAFTVGAITGALSEIHLGYAALLLPIAALLGLVPYCQAALRAAGYGQAEA